ncbi:hypothetical protein ACEWY4_003555 [Coilia grayii]|uniref:5-hydroxytryptamine receptor 3A-like n=1 Tax=Coilia grayii TaxID=363190 RepID=A0ABD1KRL4_9TELE
MTRPTRDWTTPTVVYLDVFVYAILSVQEKSQTFIPYIWVMTSWANELLSWDPADFCGIHQVAVPGELLWKPDLFLYETMEKGEGTGSPFVLLKHDGTVVTDGNQKVMSMCAMDVHKFPFDTQKCTLSFSSVIHPDNEIQLVPASNSSRATQNALEIMLSQGEWEFINVTVHTDKLIFQELGSWDKVVYTITIRRVPLLHVLTFILPILFLLVLDLASFFMPDTRGDKLAFKVTVLLAMSVLLLILTDTLPCKPSQTPLIAVYVIVTFAFMLLSVLETILVMYLTERDVMESAGTPQGHGAGGGTRDHHSEGLHLTSDEGNGKSVERGCICKANGVHQQEALPLTGCPDPYEGSEGNPTTHLLRLILQELQRGVQRPTQEHGTSCHHNTMARSINTTFFLLYLLSISLFLILLFLNWVYW